VQVPRLQGEFLTAWGSKASGRSKLTHKKQLLRRWGKQVGAECSALLRKPFVGMTTRIDPAY